MGPREYMEDAWCVRENGFSGGYFFASVMDGHGGAASSAYLRENLFSALNAEARKTIHPPAIGGSGGGGGGSPPGVAPDGTPNGGYLASALKSAYDGADESLIDHVARLGEPECWSGSCTSVLYAATASSPWWGTRPVGWFESDRADPGSSTGGV